MTGKVTRPRKHPRRKASERLVRIGNRRLIAQGLERNFRADFYHHCLTVSWPIFFAGAALVFLIINALFAFLYGIGDHAIANMRANNAADFLFFSIETLATLGYGDMHPQTTYGHMVASIEIFSGLSFIAVFTGLVFTRFSLPRARLLFAKVAVLALYDGRRTLMLRVANARDNTITDAVARLWLVRLEETKEGGTLRRFHQLALERDHSPMFALSWTLFHVIDQKSPMFGIDAHELENADANIVATLTGLDETSHQTVHARHVYGYADLRWDHQYADILERGEDGIARIDYQKFHDTLQLS